MFTPEGFKIYVYEDTKKKNMVIRGLVKKKVMAIFLFLPPISSEIMKIMKIANFLRIFKKKNIFFKLM